jgi:hypothetical protein
MSEVTRVGDVQTPDGSVTQSAIPPGGPSGAKYIVQQPHADLSAEQALSLLGTGLLKSATGTGVVSIATPGTDYALPTATTNRKGEFHISLFSVATPVAFS